MDADAAREMIEAAVDELHAKLLTIALDGEDETKMDRGAAILAKTTPQVTAVLTLALVRSVQELEERLVVYESLVAKIGKKQVDDL
jgi:hypothetical protein